MKFASIDRPRNTVDRSNPRPHRLFLGLLPPASPRALAWLAGMLMLAGCASPDAGGNRAAGTNAARPGSGPDAEALRVEQRYVIGPAAAREIGYRVDWQYPNAGRNIKILEAQGDSVFALDNRNYLTRLDRSSGNRIWRVAVAEPVREIFGITYVPELERVYVTTGGNLIVIDAANGSQIGLQRLDRIANTAPTRLGQHLIYGSRNGQVIWHSHEVAFQWRAYQVSPSIMLTPIEYEGRIIAVGNDGRIAVLNAGAASMIWSKTLLSAIAAPPAVGHEAVYVAGLDQHLWAFDLNTGREIWRHLTASPLTSPPVLVDDHLYQQIPGEGLVCFESRPLDAKGGRIVWRSPQTPGTVIAGRAGRLLAWEPSQNQMTLTEVRSGGVVEQVRLPQVQRLKSTSIDGGEIIASSADGRIVRLLARH